MKKNCGESRLSVEIDRGLEIAQAVQGVVDRREPDGFKDDLRA